MGAGLLFAVVHSVLTGERLDEVFEGHVAADVVCVANGGLHAQQGGCEGRIERFQVVGELVHDGAEF